jgi:hypothetical protein
VLCDDGTFTVVTVPGTGGPGTPTVTAGADAHCSLEETSTASLQPGWVVTYSVNGGPPSTELPFIDIVADQTVTVTITNDPTNVLGAVVLQPNFTG